MPLYFLILISIYYLRKYKKKIPFVGAKGLISKIIKTGSAKSASGNNIQCFISPVSVIGRKNIAFIKEIYIGKLVKTLHDRVKTMSINERVKTETIIKLVIDFYKLLCSKNTLESVERRFSTTNLKTLRNEFRTGNIKLYAVLEPFFNVSFENIRSVAAMLKVDLDEKVTIETEDGKTITTDRPVPVGITYLQFLEHFSSQYASVGSAVKYSTISKQPVKTGGGGNVSTIGQLDINALITYEANNILQELLTARSDHHKIKRKLYSEIAETGTLYEASLDDDSSQAGGTSELKNIYMTALGLIIK